LAEEVLERSDPIALALAQSFAEVGMVDAIGGGPAQASARETALLVREGLRLPAMGMETREYLHGPLEAVRDGFGCLVFGSEREVELAGELAAFGASVGLITDQGAGTSSEVHRIGIPSVPSLVAPILEILPVQLLVDHVARLRGLELGELRRLQPDTKVA
jgi:glucosamine--fructose-6-phosphate aminotransferase (isomerizing)